MDKEDVISIVKEIVERSCELKDKHTSEKLARVNYCCIFSRNMNEYESLSAVVKKMGKMVMETPTGELFQITPLNTMAGILRLLKIRLPDTTRPERGDADFTVDNYPEFKRMCLGKKGFKLIQRGYMEMIELTDPDFDVRAYFSHPPLDEQLSMQ